ncbi:restriction endonuclease subunit S [Bifidobacterium catenulatum]|uniref:restriction endonuclease subunit S n=1 Tax=Bifidobacterium catenulatum TaxID=1686 RepID=UPI003F8DD639
MAEQHGKALVPQIRFAGFTDPWEQRKLGELFEESDERASDREILSVSVANGIYPASESDRETNPGASLANYKIVHFGDVVYNSMRMWQGAVDASRYDGIVSPAYVVARPNSEVYARFFARLLRQPMLLKQYQQVSQGNSKDTQVLKFDDFASIGISMPVSENEQRRIGGFFDRLDSLITLHQRKYDKLCVLKKSMLDKMFPKGGSLYPEIRFAGFTDPWEQRKLGELFEESDERASDREILSVSVANGIYPASESDRETNPGASLANYKIVHFGDVVYNSMRMWQGAVDASRYDGIVSPAYVVARPNSEVYARFFARLLRQPMLLKQYQQVSQGNSKDTQVLKFDDFASIGISMPVSENEQRRIGGFFDRLDSLITLHQRKLELLRNIKKSMLDKMFV